MRRWLPLVAVLSLAVLSGVWIYMQNAGKPIKGMEDSPQMARASEEGLLFLSNGKILPLTRPRQAITGTIPHETTLKETLNTLRDTGSDALFRVTDGQNIVVRKN